MKQGIHASYENLKLKYPVQPSKVYERLQMICSCMAHWSSIFAEVDYLPHVVFPFILIFNNDEIAVLETVITIFMNWGRSWFVTFPNPPVNLIDSMAQLLQFHDKTLYIHITKTLNACPGIICWGMMSTLFSEVFDKSKWCIVFDFLLSNFEKANILQLLSIAILRELRGQILELGAEFSRSFYSFFHQTLIIDVTKLMHLLKSMIRDRSSATSRDSTAEVEEEGRGGVASLKQNMESSVGPLMFPLPKGHYPLFDGYPSSLRDGELKDRRKMLEITHILAEKKDIVASLEQKIEEYGDDHLAWMVRQKEKIASEASIRQKRSQLEQQHLEELLNIEAKISEKKLESIKAMEEYAMKEMNFIEELHADRLKANEDEAEILKTQKEYETRIARLNAVTERAELKAKEMLTALAHRRAVIDETYREERTKDFIDSEKSRGPPSLSSTPKRSTE